MPGLARLGILSGQGHRVKTSGCGVPLWQSVGHCRGVFLQAEAKEEYKETVLASAAGCADLSEDDLGSVLHTLEPCGSLQWICSINRP